MLLLTSKGLKLSWVTFLYVATIAPSSMPWFGVNSRAHEYEQFNLVDGPLQANNS